METAKFAETVRLAMVAELEELRDEVRTLADGLSEAQLWKRPLAQSNSVGHLILHLTGNLNHFVGAQLGKTGYVREREKEFTDASPPPRAQVMENLNAAVAMFRRVVGGLTEAQLMATHPTEKFGNVTKTLLHLLSHFALHRGQMSYIARLVNGTP
ncbi:MAG TPA: DinB family protein [Gemmataceae bacterium]|nr:DinB family protein [Gemmataceae bacterium]